MVHLLTALSVLVAVGGAAARPRPALHPVPTSAPHVLFDRDTTITLIDDRTNQTLPRPHVHKRGTPAGWTAMGCYNDNPSDTLSYSGTSSQLTVELCLSTCIGYGFMYAGVEAGNYCYCGTSVNTGSGYGSKATSSKCNTNCVGDSTENCGGTGYLQLYNGAGVAAAQASSSSSSLASANSAYSASTSASAYSASTSAAGYAASTSAAGYSASTSAAGYSASTSAAGYSASTSAAAYSASTSAAPSLSKYSASTSAAGYSASTSAAGYSASTSAAGYSASSSAAAYSASTSAAPSLSAYSASTSAAGYSASTSAAGYSASTSAAPSLSKYSASTSAAGYAASTSAAGYSASTSAAGYSASTSAAGAAASASAAASYSASTSAAGYSASTSAAGYSASTSAAGYSASTSAAGYSATHTTAAPVATAAALPSGWSAASTACIAEAPNSARALVGSSLTANNMTASQCIAYCSGLGYTVAGTEYSSQCFCGSHLSNGASLTLTSTACTMPCSGDSTTMCGGPYALNLYISSGAQLSTDGTTSTVAITYPSQWATASAACIAEGTHARALTGAETTSSSMTPEMCMSFCANQGYALAGVEYSVQCYCGANLQNGASLSVTSQACTMGCGGNTAEICGGSNALSLFYNSSMISNLSPDLTTIIIKDSLPTGWAAASTACIKEGTTGRALTGSFLSDPAMTVSMCANYCTGLGFPIAGVEYSVQCFCGTNLNNGASLTVPSSSCDRPCAGNQFATCGGSNAINVYVQSAYLPQLSPDLTMISVTLPSGWSATSTACVAEAVRGRALAALSTSGNNMTINSCISFCSSNGFAFAGVEYSSQCFCDNSLQNGASLSLPSSNCNMPCSGSGGQTCGGSNALQLYTNPALLNANNVVNNFATQGCIQEVGGRALTGATLSGSNMSLEVCTSFCAQGGFTYAGTEYASECYCGNSFSNGASASSLSTQCNMPCAGKSTELCGGPNAISLFMLQS